MKFYLLSSFIDKIKDEEPSKDKTKLVNHLDDLIKLVVDGELEANTTAKSLQSIKTNSITNKRIINYYCKRLGFPVDLKNGYEIIIDEEDSVGDEGYDEDALKCNIFLSRSHFAA